MARGWYHNVDVLSTPLTSVMDCVSCIREPTEDDMVLIRQIIMSDEEAIQELDSETSILYSVLERLRLQKDKHRENIRRARSLLTLARRLPPELLARIFEICAKSGWTRAPVAVSQVCSAWRKATTFPHVWSHLFLDLRSGNSIGKVEFWLSKVQHAPLHITLDIPLESPSLDEVLGLLIPRSKQWHTLVVKSVDSTTMNYVFRRCSFPLPNLRQLNVVTEMESSQGEAANMASLQDAPRLSRLLIVQPNFPRWSSITGVTKLHVVLSSSTLFTPSINATDWIEMLQALPELRDLTLELSKPGTRTYNDTQSTVDLPHLELLTLHVSPEVNGILLTMRAPALRQLHLRCSSEPLARPHMPSGAHLCQFLEFSPCVRLLELYDVDVERIDFVRCFELLPKLEELRLHDSDIADEQLRLLHGGNGYCPNLARLDFRWCNYLTGSALVNLTRSRLPQDESEGRVSSTMPMPQTRRIHEVAVINCLHVKEQDVLDLAEITLCRLLMRSDEDHCYTRGCCNNERYRQRLRLRHNNKLPETVIL